MSKMSYEHSLLKNPLDGRLLHELLDSQAEQYPDTEALIVYDMDMERSAMTYAEYRDRSMFLASSLLELGLSRGEHMLLIGQTNLQYMVFVMAMHRIGANGILLGPGTLTPDKVNLLKKLNCRMIAYNSQMKEPQKKQLVKGVKELIDHNTEEGKEKQIVVSLNDRGQDLDNTTCYLYETLLKRGHVLGQERLHEAQAKVQFEDPIVALFTAGSTGEPKVVQLTMHACVNCFADSPLASQALTRQNFCMDRPVSWTGGYHTSLSPLFSNVTTVLVPAEMALFEATVEAVLKIWEKEKCSYCSLNTALIQTLVTESIHLKYDLSHIKLFIMGGQRYSLSSLLAVFDIFPSVNVLIIYAATESAKICTEVIRKEHAVEGRYSKLSISPGVELKIVDEENKLVPRETAGEICVRSVTVFLEYLGNSNATKQTKTPTGWLYTDDVGIMDDNGKIEVIGRKKEIIKRATIKIFPSQIEKVILEHPYVRDVVVIGIPDERLNEEICACVILREDTEHGLCDENAKLQELEKWCKEQWPPGPDGLSLKPKYFLSMKRFAFVSSGKAVSTRGIKAEAMKQLGVL